MKKSTLVAGLLLASASISASAATPLWMRDAVISPDGSSIAFTYMGDIYTVPASGGDAMRITSTPDFYEASPVWSPDSRSIAFRSDRSGNFDIYLVPATGGQARRLTYNSAAETPEAFTPDGKEVLFSASIQDPASSALFPSARMTELYAVSLDGGNPRQVLATPAHNPVFTPDGKQMLYMDNKGMEDQWRKHHTSSVTRDIWSYDTKSGQHTNLTNRPGEDRNPVLSPDGSTVFFLAERDGGTFNVYSFPLSDPTDVKAITEFKVHPVRFLSTSDNGKLSFTYDGEIYTMNPGEKPVKVKIDVLNDSYNPVKRQAVTSSRGAIPSPDAKQIAFVDRGDIFVTSVDYRTTRQITATPNAEGSVTWMPDSRSFIYVSDATGIPALMRATIDRKEDLNFPNATSISHEPLFKDKVERDFPSLSPDGKKLAFIQDRTRLMVMDLDSRKVKQLTDGSTWHTRSGGFQYSWSPDGNWIVFEDIPHHHDPYTDIAIVNVNDGQKLLLTETGYFDGNPRWVLDGNAIIFGSDRYGMRSHASWGSEQDVMIIFLNREAYEKFNLSEEDLALLKETEKANKKDSDKKSDAADKKADKKSDAADKKVKDIVVEPEGLQDRIIRLTPNSSSLGDAIITADGETLYYMAAFEGGYDLWKLELNKDRSEPKIASKMGSGSMSFIPDASGKTIFMVSPRAIKKLDPKSAKVTPVNFSATRELDAAAEREYMFDVVVREERERFYTPDMHGVDWKKMTDAYRKFLPHISNNYDFATLLSELLGELNVSHTGGRYSAPRNPDSDVTASLGVLYDLAYDGKGRKIAEVLVGGPFDKTWSKVKAGDVIESVNGTDITPSDVNFDRVMANIAGQKTLVGIYSPATGERWQEVIVPVTAGRLNSLLYDRWVKQRRDDVERWSGGRLGYVHIPSMGDASFRPMYADVLGRYNDREGIVIDIRWNGGGRLHEDVEVLFSGDKYLTQVVRGDDACTMPSRRWTKPSIMVQCEACYSNAHGTPWVYKHQNLGKLVGMPVPGTMTSVNWVTLQDPSMVFGIPVVGYRTAEGNYLENSQLEPDVKVVNLPHVITQGEDTQLRTAVETLLRDLDAAKK